MTRALIVTIIAIIVGVGAAIIANKPGTKTDINTAGTSSSTKTVDKSGGVTAQTETKIIKAEISNFAFNPANLSVKKGAVVTWANKDIAPHTVTGVNGGPASEILPSGASYSYTFNDVGAFIYYCSLHPGMRGTVTVTE